MRVAALWCGRAGPAAALVLARDGHKVEILERVKQPGALPACGTLTARTLLPAALAAYAENRAAHVR